MLNYGWKYYERYKEIKDCCLKMSIKLNKKSIIIIYTYVIEINKKSI